MSNQKQPYEWDFSGSCAPKPNGVAWNQTFSVGIFQWVPKARGKQVKRGAVVKRIKGFCSDPEAVYAKARAIVAELNERESKIGPAERRAADYVARIFRGEA